MPRKPRAKQISEKLGLRRIKSESVCLNCHFTVQQKNNRQEVVSGISCESCHGAAQDWIKVHSGFSGKTAKTETKAEEAARWKLAESKGMIRRHSLYQLATNCYSCHVVPKEVLVNKGGHKPGSSFELLSWSQGEVRHNTWYSQGKENIAADGGRKRMLYRKGDRKKSLRLRNGKARRPGAKAARRCGESGAGRAGNRRDGQICPFCRAEAEK
jgi:hypothetical protein